jgi:hypothetical protein
LDLEKILIIIEVDENSHKNYKIVNENERMRKIQKTFNKSTIFIRFNTDDNEEIESPWEKVEKKLILKNEIDWKNRIETLFLTVDNLIQNQENEIEKLKIIKLFY